MYVCTYVLQFRVCTAKFLYETITSFYSVVRVTVHKTLKRLYMHSSEKAANNILLLLRSLSACILYLKASKARNILGTVSFFFLLPSMQRYVVLNTYVNAFSVTRQHVISGMHVNFVVVGVYV